MLFARVIESHGAIPDAMEAGRRPRSRRIRVSPSKIKRGPGPLCRPPRQQGYLFYPMLRGLMGRARSGPAKGIGRMRRWETGRGAGRQRRRRLERSRFSPHHASVLHLSSDGDPPRIRGLAVHSVAFLLDTTRLASHAARPPTIDEHSALCPLRGFSSRKETGHSTPHLRSAA